MERSWTETGIEIGAPAVLGVAVAFSATLLGAGAAGGAAGALAFLATAAALRCVPGGAAWPLPGFELRDPGSGMEAGASDDADLPQTGAVPSDEVGAAVAAIADELLLEDVLASPTADSRVVQLFGGRTKLTPGELQANIDRHLEQQGSPSQPPDAAAALSAALAELRRSLG
jgi:hypothetical protein